MDRAEASRISHGELRVWNPLSEGALDEAIALLDLAPGARVLDVACGRGEVPRRMNMPQGRETLGFALTLLRRQGCRPNHRRRQRV